MDKKTWALERPEGIRKAPGLYPGGVPPLRSGEPPRATPGTLSFHPFHSLFLPIATSITTTSQKAVSMGPRRPLGRPKLIFYDLGIDFGLILGSSFHQESDIIRKWRKYEISEEYNAKRASEPSKTFDFRFEFSSTFVVFSKHLPKLVFPHFGIPRAPKSRRIEFSWWLFGTSGASKGLSFLGFF